MKWVTLTSHEIGVTVRPKLTGPATVIQHDGEGWQQVQRMWRTSFTEWQGGPGLEVDIPVMFDQMRYNPAIGSAMNSVEAECQQLQRLCEKLANQPRTAILIFDALGAIPHDYTHDHTKKWVVGSTVTWGDYTIHPVNRYRVRQEVTIPLWEYVPDQILQAKERLPARPVPKTYKIKKGDTLQKIAAYFYGDQAKWHDIASLNKIRDPLHLKVGRLIKLPR